MEKESTAFMVSREEEVLLEVEAVTAVYDDDCRVIRHFPPHLAVHFSPRTADDLSQQFVEIVLGIQANVEYPEKPPHIYVVESKGLDENRLNYLIGSISKKAEDLSSSLMLVALCEEAVEILSSINYPEGNCPLCLYPLVVEGASGSSMAFMKLMSCYHCFHSECIIRWWKWFQDRSLTNEATEATHVMSRQRGAPSSMSWMHATCPVCRRIFDAKDIEHILNYLEKDLCELKIEETDIGEEDKLFLQSDTEISRRQKFGAILKLQKEHSGLIEPKQSLAISPGMYLPTPATSTADSVDDESGTSRNTSEGNPGSSMNKATSRKQRFNSSRRRHWNQNFNIKQWIRKAP